jgi:hypothetical protein
MEAFSSNVRHFEQFEGFLKPISEKWRLVDEIFNEIEALLK